MVVNQGEMFSCFHCGYGNNKKMEEKDILCCYHVSNLLYTFDSFGLSLVVMASIKAMIQLNYWTSREMNIRGGNYLWNVADFPLMEWSPLMFRLLPLAITTIFEPTNVCCFRRILSPQIVCFFLHWTFLSNVTIVHVDETPVDVSADFDTWTLAYPVWP